MDHSDDGDTKLPPSAAPQQAQPAPGSAAARHHPSPGHQQQQQHAPRWDAAAASAAAAQQFVQQQQSPYAAAAAAASLPQQQQQQQLAAAAAATYPPHAGAVPPYPAEVEAAYLQRQRLAQQQLLYQQQQAAAAGFPYPAASLAAAQQQQMTSPGQPPPQGGYIPPGYAAHQFRAPPVGGGQPALPQHPPGYLVPSPQAPQPSVVTSGNVNAAAAAAAVPPPQQPFLQPKVGRLPADRPIIKLSISLIDTYKNINTVYYEDRDARRAARAKEKNQKVGAGGSNNNGWDDENYDYIVTSGEMFYGRYKIKERIGKGSFGQVVRAEDMESHREVAIKIIKSKKPFLMQAKTEIELLTHLWEKDPEDQHNIVRLLTHFMYRNHQCLVFEMLSLNLYELLKNTQFGGVSLNLIRKFGKQVLKALTFLAKKEVDIIHCDLKPENILLRHPKKSGIKVIDFGSSCRSNKRMYSYIQSRFYRSPEVMLGLPYSVAIDMWSLGCILAEMHTGEPLFSGSDQFDQMQKIVKLLGMVPTDMLEKSSDHIKLQFFEKAKMGAGGADEWQLRQTKLASAKTSATDAATATETPAEPKELIVPSTNPIASLSEVITAGSRQKKKFPPSEAYNSRRNYELFIDLVSKMLAYKPEDRLKPHEALQHPFITAGEPPGSTTTAPK